MSSVAPVPLFHPFSPFHRGSRAVKAVSLRDFGARASTRPASNGVVGWGPGIFGCETDSFKFFSFLSLKNFNLGFQTLDLTLVPPLI